MNIKRVLLIGEFSSVREDLSGLFKVFELECKWVPDRSLNWDQLKINNACLVIWNPESMDEHDLLDTAIQVNNIQNLVVVGVLGYGSDVSDVARLLTSGLFEVAATSIMLET